MKQSLRLWAVGCGLAAALCLCGSVAAQEPAGLSPRGQGVFKVWGLEVYRARLWTHPDFQPQDPVAVPLALELEYLRKFTGRSIAERSIQEMRRIGPFTEEQAQRWQAQMASLFPDVERGHTLRGTHRPGWGAVFEHNGRTVGEVADPEFSRLFFGIWLSPKTSGSDLRAALIALPRPGG